MMHTIKIIFNLVGLEPRTAQLRIYHTSHSAILHQLHRVPNIVNELTFIVPDLSEPNWGLGQHLQRQRPASHSANTRYNGVGLALEVVEVIRAAASRPEHW